jgi:hypothetical protein
MAKVLKLSISHVADGLLLALYPIFQGERLWRASGAQFHLSAATTHTRSTASPHLLVDLASARFTHNPIDLAALAPHALPKQLKRNCDSTHLDLEHLLGANVARQGNASEGWHSGEGSGARHVGLLNQKVRSKHDRVPGDFTDQ